MKCTYRFGMYAVHELPIRPPCAIESRWPPRVRGMYVVHTPLAPWIRNGQILIRNIIRSGIAINAPCASPMHHRCAVDMQHMQNSSAADVPSNHLGDLAAYLFIFFVCHTSAVASPASGTGALGNVDPELCFQMVGVTSPQRVKPPRPMIWNKTQ